MILGIGENGIRENVSGQSFLGYEGFVDSLIGYVKGNEDVAEHLGRHYPTISGIISKILKSKIVTH